MRGVGPPPKVKGVFSISLRQFFSINISRVSAFINTVIVEDRGWNKT
jgi:hypothetical protein